MSKVDLLQGNGDSCENNSMSQEMTEWLANHTGGLSMSTCVNSLRGAVVGGLLVLLPIYLAVLLLKGMKAVVSLVRPISALSQTAAR
jgi:hypothetical protein